MGHIVKTPAGTFRANWRDATGRQKAKTFDTRKEAAAYLAETEASLARGTYVDPRAGRIHFRDFAAKWAEVIFTGDPGLEVAVSHYKDQKERIAALGRDPSKVKMLPMLYTVIAMVNAVVISASDRREEFATARVAGLTRAQVVRVALWEALAVVAIGLLLGGLAAAGTVAGMAVAIGHMIGLRVVSVQWPLLGALALGAAVIVGISSVLTTLAATRTPAIRLVAARE